LSNAYACNGFELELECEDDICCSTHVPAFIINDVCHCGWSIDGAGIEGTTAANVCSCAIGQPWIFNGSGSVTFSGPATLIDNLVIFGHNMESATITTTPLTQFGGGAAQSGRCTDIICDGGYLRPITVSFADVPESVDSVTVTIDATSTDGGPVCIDQIILGRKFFLPSNALLTTFINPFTGTDYEYEIKESDCGLLSRRSRRVAVPLAVEIDCINERYAFEQLRPLMRYLRNHQVVFYWSINNAPQEVFVGWLDGVQSGAVYEDANTQMASIQARGFISQLQDKVAA